MSTSASHWPLRHEAAPLPLGLVRDLGEAHRCEVPAHFVGVAQDEAARHHEAARPRGSREVWRESADDERGDVREDEVVALGWAVGPGPIGAERSGGELDLL